MSTNARFQVSAAANDVHLGQDMKPVFNDEGEMEGESQEMTWKTADKQHSKMWVHQRITARVPGCRRSGLEWRWSWNLQVACRRSDGLGRGPQAEPVGQAGGCLVGGSVWLRSPWSLKLTPIAEESQQERCAAQPGSNVNSYQMWLQIIFILEKENVDQEIITYLF